MVHGVQRVGKRFLALAICKRCGKEIKFVKTKKGKWMSVDCEQVIVTPVEKFGKPYMTEDGHLIYGLPTAPNCIYIGISDIKANICHFVTCSYGNEQHHFKKRMVK